MIQVGAGGRGGRRWAQWAAGAPRRDIICTLDNVETEAQRLAPVLVTCHYWPSVTCYHTPGATWSINWAKENVSAARSLAPPAPANVPTGRPSPCNVRAVVVTALLLFSRARHARTERDCAQHKYSCCGPRRCLGSTYPLQLACGGRARALVFISASLAAWAHCFGNSMHSATCNKLQCGPGVGHLATGQLSTCGR